jgi:hypothetical protein
MNVTPDRDVPIIPNATTYQGEDLLPKKNDSLLSFLPVYHEINDKNKK